MNIHPRAWATAALLSASATPALAEVDLAFEAGFTAPAPVAAAESGHSVALDGDFALVGAPGDAVRGTGAGAVHVWRRSGGVWAFEETIRPAGVSAGDGFGSAVAVLNGVAMIGAPGDDGIGADAGRIYVFLHGSSGWSQQQSFVASSVTAGDAFGSAIAMDGDTAVVGAPQDDLLANNSGAAYVLKLGVSFWGEQAKLFAPGGASNDQFGVSVGISGDRAVVGAPAVNANGVNSGAAYTFERTGSSWSAGVMLPQVGTSWFDSFGSSVDIDNLRIAVGAPGDDSLAVDAGGAWTYVHDGANWIVEGGFEPVVSGGERIGSSVALAGETLFVGAANDDYSNSEDGSLYAAEWGGLGWVVSERTGNPAGGISDALGSSLAVDGDLVLVGVPLVDNGMVDSGSAWLFSTTTEPVGVPVCLGDGSGADCPCDNTGGPGEGCANSTGVGAKLVASGEAVVGSDSLQLVVVGAREDSRGIFLQGRVELGIPFRDGLLCVTQGVVRMEVISLDASGAGSSEAEISVIGDVVSGETCFYQFWYRDPDFSPCGSGSNLSGAVQVQWQ